MLHSEKRSEPLYRIDMYIDRQLWNDCKALAKQRDLSAAELVRRLVAAELRKAARPARAEKSRTQEPGIPF